MPPPKSNPERERYIKNLISREYKIYQEEERQASLPRTLYEKACNAAARTLNVKPDKKAREKLEQAISFAHLKTTPEGITSLTFLFLIVTIFPVIILMTTHFLFHAEDGAGLVVGELIVIQELNQTSRDPSFAGQNAVVGFSGLTLGYGVLTILLILFFTYYLYIYPNRLRKKYEIAAGSDIVTMILYIVMYMKNTPNLEGAVRFAAENIGGELGYELKKMLWDVEVGNFLSMQEALTEYTTKWAKNRPFVEAVQLIITSMKQAGPRRETLLEEAVDVILKGSREQARDFNERLKMPVTVINALGIILPVMGLVLFPIVAVFLKVEATILFVGYDILLPLILYFVITNTMEIRPATFSKIDIQDNPNAAPKGKFKRGGRYVKAWPIALLAAIVLIAAGVFLYFAELEAVGAENFEGIIPAVAITFGVSIGFALYNILVSSQNLKVRSETRKVESEFAEALFQLGNQVSAGTPIELSMEHSMDRIKNLKIKSLFEKAMKNMKMLGFTFQQAFFDEKYGAVNFYPSRLIKSIMKTVVESSKRGVRTAADAMVSISRYLKGVHDTQEEVKESLSDTLNSLKFQAFFLTPMISGIVGTLAIIIIQILRGLAQQAPDLGGSVDFLADLGSIAITPFQFIMIVAVYMIETSIILAMFINAIENGDDEIGKQNTIGYTLLIGFVVFAVCLLLSLAIFKPLVTTTLI